MGGGHLGGWLPQFLISKGALWCQILRQTRYLITHLVDKEAEAHGGLSMVRKVTCLVSEPEFEPTPFGETLALDSWLALLTGLPAAALASLHTFLL